MNSELVGLLTAYLRDSANRPQLVDFVDSFDWNDRSEESLTIRDNVGTLELLIVEIAEGLREEQDLREYATEFLNRRAAVSV